LRNIWKTEMCCSDGWRSFEIASELFTVLHVSIFTECKLYWEDILAQGEGEVTIVAVGM
jgi:hypothetical protein